MDWSIQINKVENGYICEHWEEMKEPGHYEKRQWVIEEMDNEYSELEAMKCLLFYVKDHFEVYYNDHNKKNLYIEIRESE